MFDTYIQKKTPRYIICPHGSSSLLGNFIGIPIEQLRDELKELKEKETNPDGGKIFAYVYTQKHWRI